VKRARDDGFTLLELTVVVFILAIVASFVVPRVADVSGVALGATARRLSQSVRYLYEEAALRGSVYGLVLDLDEQRVHVVRLDSETGEFVEDDAMLSRELALPDGVRLTAVVLPSVGRLDQGAVPIYFYPEGFADPAWIQLGDDRERGYTVIVDPIRGRAEVVDGAVGPADAFG
jgi:prepilin-type N-terminal cleavage/methylation domain-containing protein